MELKIKKTKCLIIIIAFIILSIGAGIILYKLSLPKGTYQVEVKIGCVYVNEGNIEWSKAVISNNLYNKNKYVNDWSKGQTRINMAVMRNLKYSETDDIVTDAEAAEFVIKNKEGEEIFKISFVYDFYLKKVYAQKEEKWYLIENSAPIDKIIINILDCPGYYNPYSCWRGQSTYSDNEFLWLDPDFVFQEEPTFRYNLYWTPSKENYEDERENYQTEGFRNTDEVIISNSEEAVQRAAGEFDFSNPDGYAYYDETCGYWMVEIYDKTGFENLTYEECRVELIRNTKTVIIDDRGITKEIYNHITMDTVFLGWPEEWELNSPLSNDK